MRIIDTESVKCPRCKVELDVPLYEVDGIPHYGMKFCHQCGADLFNYEADKEIALSVKNGTKAKYSYTDEQVSAYQQGVEDCAKDTIGKRQKCELDILRGINGTAVAINDYRVTSGKIYGMLVTEGHFKLNCSDVIHAICQEHEALKR